MNWPPMMLHLRIPTDRGAMGLWLPWFLVYPILLGLMLIALPVVLIMTLFFLPTGKARTVVLAGPFLWRILFSMRGLSVDVQTGPRKVLISFV